MEFTGKSVIVTGAGGGGSGRAIASRFSREGAVVVITDLNEAGARETMRLIEGQGGRAAVHPADVRVEAQVHDLVKFAAAQAAGGLAVLVNNASAPFHPDDPLDYWPEIVQTDLLGTMYATRCAIDAMRRTGGGAVVNMSSISAVWHGRRTPAPGYDAAKAAVLRLTTMLDWLGPREKIRVNCLAPGWIASEQVRAYWEPLTGEQRKARGAPSRLLTLDEVAGAVFRLATDESLSGRVMVWWSEDEPRLIPFGDRGYERLEELLRDSASSW